MTEVYSNRFRMPDGRPQLASGRTHRSDEPGIREVVDYALDVIDALGASVGATHTEVRLTSRGPRLVEFNGRLMGPTQPSRYFIDAQGFSQATVFADVLAGRHQAARAALSRRESAQYLGFYLLTGAASGVVTAFTDEHLRTLDSFRCIGKAPRTGDVITLDNRTTDADLGIVFLAHRSVDRLEADLALVEEMETNGMIHTISPL